MSLGAIPPSNLQVPSFGKSNVRFGLTDSQEPVPSGTPASSGGWRNMFGRKADSASLPPENIPKLSIARGLVRVVTKALAPRSIFEFFILHPLWYADISKSFVEGYLGCGSLFMGNIPVLNLISKSRLISNFITNRMGGNSKETIIQNLNNRKKAFQAKRNSNA